MSVCLPANIQPATNPRISYHKAMAEVLAKLCLQSNSKISKSTGNSNLTRKEEELRSWIRGKTYLSLISYTFNNKTHTTSRKKTIQCKHSKYFRGVVRYLPSANEVVEG